MYSISHTPKISVEQYIELANWIDDSVSEFPFYTSHVRYDYASRVPASS